MKKGTRKPTDSEWLKNVGKNIENLILSKGYSSVYEFWIEKAGDHISRASLNYLVRGEFDPKITTIRKVARLLDTKIATLLQD